MNRIILTIILGCISGIIGGSLGLGGTSIILPGLLILGIIKDYKIAVGTTLFTLLPPISIFAVIEYYKRKQIDLEIGIIACISYMLFAYFGSMINKQLSSKTLEYSTAIFFLIGSIYFFWKGYITNSSS